ncbi:MAG: hypothetical protein H6712_08555 [Myxococcales bacterium]|nr:hypothetical protein [Myxococcales bacterium]MCB9713890.1 hypothetical protein [Myxococcales bacterium]
MEGPLELRNLSAGYGPRTAIRDLSARLPRGRISAVLGPGASGKSTLLRVLEGSTPPDLWWTGEIPSVEAWRLPQPRRGVAELDDLAEAAEQLERWASEAGMDFSVLRQELLTQPAMLARLGRIVASKAELLLLDEPDAGAYDQDLSALTLVLRDLSMRGQTVLLVTHNLGLANRLADHLLLLVDGDKLDEGPPSRVRSNPSCARARDLLTWGG